MYQQVKRIIALIALLSLTATSIAVTARPALADDIDTTITVESSTCVDETPSSLSFSPWFGNTSFNDFNPDSAWMPAGPQVELYMYVNECLDQGWHVTASVTDFHSGANSIPAAGYFRVAAYNSQTRGGVHRPNSDPIWAPVPGTTVLPVSPTGFTSAGDNISTANVPISTGTAESTGEMAQIVRTSLSSPPSTTPPGDYAATFTLTLNPGSAP